MDTNMTGFSQKFCALDESSLSIERVKRINSKGTRNEDSPYSNPRSAIRYKLKSEKKGNVDSLKTACIFAVKNQYSPSAISTFPETVNFT